MSARQLLVLLGGVVAVLGLVSGVGLLGLPPIAESAGGALAADATLVAPAGPAFSIWTPIYAGLLALAVWQAVPARREARGDAVRVRRVDVAVAVSMVANTAWVLTAQAGLLELTLPVLLVVLVALVVAQAGLLADRPASRVEALLLDGTVGLYLGWVTVATVANATALLEAVGLQAGGAARTAWSVAVVLVAAGIGVVVTLLARGRPAFPAAVVWGLAWVAVARTAGEPESVPVAVAAASGALLVAGAAVVAGVRARR